MTQLYHEYQIQHVYMSCKGLGRIFQISFKTCFGLIVCFSMYYTSVAVSLKSDYCYSVAISVLFTRFTLMFHA